MYEDAKVVLLPKMATGQATLSPLALLPVVLQQVRDKAAQQFTHALQALFDNADDTLFEMADKARDNAERGHFFEAMRDLRLRRKNIVAGALEGFFDAFADLGQGRSARSSVYWGACWGKLIEASNDELERRAAVESMVEKVLRRDGCALSQLTARFNVLLAKTVDNLSHPLGPGKLCQYFLQSGEQLRFETKVQLIQLKLFDKYVLGAVGGIYAQINQLLSAIGVLAELKPDFLPRNLREVPVTEQPSMVTAVDTPQVSPGKEAAFGAWQPLLVKVRGRIAPKRVEGAPTYPISTQDLFRLLSHLQRYVPANVLQDDFDLRHQLEHLLTRVSMRSGKSRVLGVVDEDVINLIAMLFESILGDDNLPDSLKLLIVRMQIPMLKVAVLDTSFFSSAEHPARRLLNHIASEAIGLEGVDDYRRDGLYQCIEQTVQRLLNEFVDDPNLFTELLIEFQALSADYRRRGQLLEQRTRDAELGRVKAQTARLRVLEELEQRLNSKRLPKIAVSLLQEVWSQVLLLTLLQHGERSVEWQSVLQNMDDLIWSVGEHQGKVDRSRLIALLPGLLSALREGFANVAVDAFVTEQMFSQLQALHLKAIEHSTEDRLDFAVQNADAMEEIVLGAPFQPFIVKEKPAPSEDDEALLWVKGLRPGTWFQIQEDEQHSLRCKLTAIIEATDRYIFVGRTGMKVLEKTRMGLAVEYRRGAVRVLDDSLLFDRALESVLGHLRRIKP